MKIIERVFNAETNETLDIERELSVEELLQYERDEERAQKIISEQNEMMAKRHSALAKLAALGLNEDDLQALGL